MDKQIEVVEVIREAWRLVKGTKWAIMAPILTIAFAYFIGAMIVVSALEIGRGTVVIVGTLAVIGFLYLFFGLLSGIIKTTIERARGNLLFTKMSFHTFSRVTPVLLTTLLWIIILAPPSLIPFISPLKEDGLAMLAIKTLYGLIVGSLFYMSVPLAVDKTNSPFTAIAQSFKVIYPHWLKIIGISIIVELITIILWAPLGLGVMLKNNLIISVGAAIMFIAFVWIIPFMFMIQGVLYHKLID